jgi:hypothetical protein
MNKVTKEVSIEIPALGATAVLAHVTEYRVEEGIYVFDLYDADNNLVAKSRYSLIADAPFELTQADIDILNSPVEEEV